MSKRTESVIYRPVLKNASIDMINSVDKVFVSQLQTVIHLLVISVHQLRTDCKNIHMI